MRFWQSLFFLMSCLAPFLAKAQIAPLPLDADTIALWNFDSDVGDQVTDLAPGPLIGTAYTTEHSAIPNIPASFNLARKFTGQSSFVDFGVVQGSKLDFTGANELSIEAVIHLLQPASSNHIIVSLENIRLMVVNNQLAAYIRQPSGLYGVVSSRTLALNTSYRVGLHYKNKALILSINNRTDSLVSLDYPISAPQFSNARASVGGDIFARFFPGYIDDVRIRDVVGIDAQGPGIQLVEPSSFQVTTARPNFLINLSDDLTGVDPSSIEVYLNGIAQTSISRSATQISGTLDDDFSSVVLNEVKIIASDFQGNINEKSFFFTYASIFNRQEYTTDVSTLALWHMNDFAPGILKDDSGNNRTGYGNVKEVQMGDGVFDQGRLFVRGNGVSFDAIRFNTNQFTFEGWFSPESNYVGEEVLFYNGQIKVGRYNNGYIRVVLYTSRGEKSYGSSDVLIPVGELHHLAVTWDGTKPNQNLIFYVDGLARGTRDAVSDCDFDTVPKVGIIGQYYSGLMDELRFSNVPRMGFSIPVFDNQAITFLNLKNGTSVNSQFPEFHATLNSGNTINTNTVKVLLNGVLQPSGPKLTITSTGIDGTFTSPLKIGLNNLEVSYLDNLGNQRKKSQYFYFIKRSGGSEYAPDQKTAGLWHFNQISTTKIEDSSAGKNDLLSTQMAIESGVIGTAGKGTASFSNRMPLNCRSFTIEGFIKTNTKDGSFRTIYGINGENQSHYVRLNSANGNAQIYFNTSTASLDTEIPQAIPVDDAFHHLALVYDGSRGISQLLLIVDGVVKRSLDYHNSCDFTGGNNFVIGESGYFSFDEFRVSKEAKYSFNLQDEVNDRPVLMSSSIADGQTVSNPLQTFTFKLGDADGTNVDQTKLYLNGLEQEVTVSQSFVRATLETEFTSSLQLSNGANFVQIKMQDMKGNDQVKSFYVYLFAKGSPVEYQDDENTLFLYHLNEASGDFTDSSSFGNNVSAAGWTTNLGGVFGAAASNYTYNSFPINVSNTANFSGYTFEAWVKNGGVNDFNLFYSNNFTVLVSRSGQIGVSINGTTLAETTTPVLQNTYHHYAVVIDKEHSYQNFYLLRDGKVVYGTMTSINLNIPSILSGSFGYGLYNSVLDEVRFSSTPRYKMTSSL